MFRIITLLSFILLSLSIQAQRTVIFEEDFESGTARWNLNSSSLPTTGSLGDNHWVVNDSFAGGSFTVGTSTFLVPDVPNQPSAITGFPNSNYLHIQSKAAAASGIGSSSLLDANSTAFTSLAAGANLCVMNDDISTLGLRNVRMKFYWTAEMLGGRVHMCHSIDTGLSWFIDTTFLVDESTWKLDSFERVAWTGQPYVRFGFLFDNTGTDSSIAQPGISIDQIWMDADSGCGISLTSFSTSPVTCPGGTNGTILMAASGLGISPLQYSIDSGLTYSSAGAFSSLAQGTYHLAVREGFCEEIFDTLVVVGGPAPLNIVNGKMDPTSSSPCNGWVSLSVSGGTPPYTYLWDDPSAQVTDTAINLCDGVYNCQVTDSLGCDLGLHYVVLGTASLGELQNFSLSISPNPNNGRFRVVWGEASGSETTLTVLDHLGRLVFSQPQPSGVLEQTLDLGFLPSGVYHLVVQNSKGSAFSNIVIR